MPRVRMSAVRIIVTFAIFCPLIIFSAELSYAQDLLTIGRIGSNPIPLHVWTNQPTGTAFKAGDRVVIYFKADRDCYVTALNVSEKGDVSILFPSKEHPDSFIAAGREYTIFGDKSKIRLVMGKGLPEVKTVFYVTPAPITLPSPPEDKLVLQISADQKEFLSDIAQTIERASNQAEFNRVLLTIKSEQDGGPTLKLMGPTPAPGVPERSDSERPEGVTGTQGLKPNPER